MNHDLRRLFGAVAVGQLGSAVGAFALPLVAYAVSRSGTAAALVTGAWMVGFVAATVPTGLLVDRLPRRRLLVAAYATTSAATAAAGVLALTDRLSIAALAALAVVVGAGEQLTQPAETAAMRDLVDDRGLPGAVGRMQTRTHATTVLGGPIGGVAYGLGRAAPLLLHSAAHAVAAVLCARISRPLPPPTRVPDRRRGAAWRELRAGLGIVRGSRFLRVLLVWNALSNTLVNAALLTVLLRMVDAGVPAWQLGAVEAAAGIGGVLGGLVAPRLVRRFATGRLAAVGAAGTTVALALPVLGVDPWLTAISNAVAVGCVPVTVVGLISYRLATIPRDVLGRVMAVMGLASSIGMPLGPVLAGLLLAAFGGTATTALLVAPLVLGVVMLAVSASIRRIGRPETWPTLETAPTDESPATLPA